MNEKFAIFDMDGTLIDSMPMWGGVADRLLGRFGMKAAPDVNEKLFVMNEHEGAEYLCKAYGLNLTPEQLHAALIDTLTEGYLTVDLKPGARKVLDTFRERGVKMCVLSSTGQELLVPVLKRLDLLKYFEFTKSCEVGNGKDKPDCYLQAMERLGAPSPQQTAVFDDAPHGVHSAASVGFVVYGMADDSALAQREQVRRDSTMFLNDLSELPL